jgi:hypothetical protein
VIERRLYILYLLIFTLTWPPLCAGGSPDQKQIAKIQRKVVACSEHERRVTVETYYGRLFKGSVSEAGAHAFVVIFDGRPTTLKSGEVGKINWPSEVSKQVIVVIEATAVVGGLVVVPILLGGLKG